MSETKLILGDCIEKMKDMPDNSVDSIVTDPPYGLSFMGKKWDYDVPSVEIWEECLRVLKPGGYLLSFAGTRTQHRMAVNIEDAGFEIRDMIAWVYGSGFPKSHNISKAIDKMAGAEREVIGKYQPPDMDKPWNLTRAKDERTVDVFSSSRNNLDFTAPATPEAKQWDGWGTALKPALEPITVARKPLSEKTVASNVLKWGTGGINIDGCRVPANDSQLAEKYASVRNSRPRDNAIYGPDDRKRSEGNTKPHSQGRFPTNFIHDGSQMVIELFRQTGKSTGGTA